MEMEIESIQLSPELNEGADQKKTELVGGLWLFFFFFNPISLKHIL